jgi:hypothetical protein
MERICSLAGLHTSTRQDSHRRRYPKIQALKSGGVLGGDAETVRNQTHLTAGHVAFLDMNRLYFELERFKAERGWYNLNLKQENIAPLLIDQTWYQLLIPAEELAFDSFEKVGLWQDIALSLLKKYTERYYTFRKREWELPHLEYQDLAASDPNFLGAKDEPDKGYYRILIDKSQEEIAAKLTELKESIAKGELKKFDFQGMKAIWFGRHLYEPLLYVDQKIVEISPVPLNKGERRFVEDLKTFHENDGGYFTGKELYLLRNLSKGRGVGFFEAGNFHPDFIIWLLSETGQHIVFVDPKGIRNIGATDPKIQFYETIKEIEQRMGQEIVSRLRKLTVSPGLPATEDQFEIHRDKLRPILASCALENGKPAYQLDRLAVTRDLIESTVTNVTFGGQSG